MTINEIRKLNLKILINEVGTQALLADIADTKASYLSQILSDKIDRNMGRDLARKLESTCNKEHGWMDVHHPEEKEWNKVTGHMEGYYDAYVKNVTREKLDRILDIADQVLEDTGKNFAEKEHINLYLLAIEFALSRDFPPEFIEQYLKHIIKERV